MKEIENTSVIEYRDELIVELTGTGEFDDVSVISYQFEYDENDRQIVSPKQSIDTTHFTAIKSALDDQEYHLKDNCA